MAGQLWGWGINLNGELGDNTNVSKSSPVQNITGSSSWVYLAFSKSNTNRVAVCIKTDGTLWTWGRNNFGQIGDYTITNKSSPVQTVAGGTNWNQAACSPAHTGAIKTDGSLWVWGRNAYGQLGNNSSVNASSPVQTITFGNNWSQVSCGYRHIVAIKKDGTLWCWGQNSFGQLGDSTTTDRSSPVQTITGGTNWTYVSCGYSFTAALKTDGTLWAWGQNNNGQLGDGTTSSRSSPVQIITFSNDWSKVEGFGSSTIAIKRDGTLWLWGRNHYGQLGDNTLVHRSSPIQTIAGGNNWNEISGGGSFSGAIKKDGTMWLWGLGANGSLGDNTSDNKSSPVQTVMGGNRWSALAGSTAIYENDANQLGINTQPLAGYNSNQLLVQPKININDSAGSLVRIATNSVTVAVQSGTATLSGTTTVTAVNGVATFTDLVLTGSGAVTLRFTSSGLTLVDSSSFTVSLTLPIIPKRSEVSGKVPTSGQLNIGELAINIDDKKGFVKKSDGTVLNIFNGKVADGGTF